MKSSGKKITSDPDGSGFIAAVPVGGGKTVQLKIINENEFMKAVNVKLNIDKNLL